MQESQYHNIYNYYNYNQKCIYNIIVANRNIRKGIVRFLLYSESLYSKIYHEQSVQYQKQINLWTERKREGGKEKNKERSERLGYTTCTTQITRSKETKSVLIQYTHPVYKESIYHTILMGQVLQVCVYKCVHACLLILHVYVYKVCVSHYS